MSRSARPTNLRTPSDAPTPDPLPPGVVSVVVPLDALAARWTVRLDEVAAALGVSRSVIERERRAGRFPKPDRTIGRIPLWKPETIRAWVDGGGRA